MPKIGFRDMNYTRVRATDKYIRSCHNAFVIARIDRVTTDVGISNFINRYGQHAAHIVCTHSEVIPLFVWQKYKD